MVTLRDVDAKSPANTLAERLAELKFKTVGDTLADVKAEALLFCVGDSVAEVHGGLGCSQGTSRQ